MEVRRRGGMGKRRDWDLGVVAVGPVEHQGGELQVIWKTIRKGVDV